MRGPVEFDNEDEDSLLWLAWLSLERGAIGDAEQNYRRVLVLANGDGDAWYSYWARLGLGDEQVQRGDLAAARREYEIAGAIAERLAKSEPDNAGCQRDVAVSCGRWRRLTAVREKPSRPTPTSPPGGRLWPNSSESSRNGPSGGAIWRGSTAFSKSHNRR
jgi:tetratricopeptide (TPR) repeat protein